MRTISLRLDDHTDAALTAYCALHRLSQTDAVKAAISHLVEAQRATPAELAAKFGLIGSFRSGIGDLAQNHSAHLKQQLRAKFDQDSVAAPAPTPAPAPAPSPRRRVTAR